MSLPGKPASQPKTSLHRSDRAFGMLLLVGIPGSIFTAAATVPMALVALRAIWMRLSGHRADVDIVRLLYVFGACYLALLAADLLNGGGIENFQFTAVNYLPLLGAVGAAFAIRRSGLGDGAVLAALVAAVWLAACISLFRSLVLDVARPGGLYMNPIPFGLVMSMWGMLLLSFALRAGRHRWALLASAAVAVVPVVLTESKIAWLAATAGYGVVVLHWSFEHREWRKLGLALVTMVLISAVAYATVGHKRFERFFSEIAAFIETGDRSRASFGHRAVLAEIGILAFLDGPLLGHGFSEHVDAAFAKLGPDDPDVTHLTHLHNDYVTHLAAYGYVGLVFLLVFFATLFWIARRAADPPRRGAGYALIAMAGLYMAGEIFLNIEPVTGPFAIVLAVLLMRPGSGSASPGSS